MFSTPQYRGSATSTPPETTVRHRTESASSWHPKLTPYRLIIITTTIAFGTAKTVLAQQQSGETPITLEWLFGTVIFLLFFVVSSYDSREDVPAYLHLLFKPDCMDLVWKFLWTWFSIRRPKYTSEECSTPGNVHWARPLITPYRILVCTTVTSFGMSKAMLGYYGFSTDVTWTDWALGVPMTTGLYVLGLYEYNPANFWRTFFASDQIHIFYSVSSGVVVTLRFSICVAWTAFWGSSLQAVTYDPKWDMSTPRPVGFKPTLKSFCEDMVDHGLKLMIQEFILVALVLGVAGCFLVLRQCVATPAMKRVLRFIIRVIPMDSYVSDLSTRQPFTLRRPSILRVVYHIALHAAGLIMLAPFTMVAAGFTVTLQGALRPTGRDIICLTTPYLIPTFFGFVTLGMIWTQGSILFSLLYPLWRWYVTSVPLGLGWFSFPTIFN